MGRRVKKNFPSEKLIDILKSMNLDFQVYEARYPKSPKQIKDLEATINATPADVVVSGTPIDLTKVVKINKPLINVKYELG